MQTLSEWEAHFEQFLQQMDSADAAHDLLHIKRVVANAKRLGALDAADMHIVIPAAWLHDCVSVAKNSPLRSQASRLAAERATQFLSDSGYASGKISAIAHAIAAHSFSANIPTETLEARIVQDADRLDSLGAIGVARCFITGAGFGSPLYDADEPIPMTRSADDRVSMIDHFFTKLLTLANTMKTAAGQAEAQKRTQFMRDYLAQLQYEIGA